jgi:ribosome recycling factor
MLDNLKNESQVKMQKSIDALNQELAKIRTGRAHPSLLESILVDSYGQQVELNQVASISVQDARTLVITPFDKRTTETIDKAVRNSNLGLNPVSAGTVIRVPLPPLNEERRMQFVKQVKVEAEKTRVSIRNIRRDIIASAKKLLKDKEISEDDEKKFADQIQKITDKFVEQVDRTVTTKEQDLLTV